MPANNISSVVANWLCTSCGACKALCPQDAITFNETVGGYVFPRVDTFRCTNCGLCLKVCPGTNLSANILKGLPKDPFSGTCIDSYVGKTLDPKTLTEGQSGGVVTALLQCAFEHGFIEAALTVAMDFGNPPRPKAQLTKSMQELVGTQKSKYTPVPLLSTLRELHSSSYRKVGIVGLPCHIQGLLNLLDETTQFHDFHFVTIGLFCDRVMTTRAIDFLAEKSHCPQGEEYFLKFRDKSCGGYPGNVSIQNKNHWSITLPASSRMEIKDRFTPARCRICFDKMNTLSDITVGDPWGIEGFDKSTGESVTVVRTEKGERLFQEACNLDYLSMRKIPYSSILKGQHISEKRKHWTSYCLAWKEVELQLPKYYSQIQVEVGSSDSKYISDIQESVALDSFTSVTKLLAFKKKQVFWKHFSSRLKSICFRIPRWIVKKALMLGSRKGR